MDILLLYSILQIANATSSNIVKYNKSM